MILTGNRIIKESICASDKIDGLSWFEEVLFYRLIVNCDDYGRFDGRIAIIKNKLFPLKENLTQKTVQAAINKLARTGLVALYTFEGKPYLYLPTWNHHQNIRTKRSKYPDPSGSGAQINTGDGLHTSEYRCIQMNTDDCKCYPNPIQSESESESISGSEINPSIPLPPSSGGTPAEGQPWDGWMDRAKATEYFSERFDLLHAEERYGEHAEAVKGMATLLAEVVSDPAPTVRVSSRAVPKERFLQLTGEHAGYVAQRVAAQTGEIHNLRSYLLTALYRAPETVSVRSKGKSGTRNTAAQTPEQSAKQTAWLQDFLAEYGKEAAENG